MKITGTQSVYFRGANTVLQKHAITPAQAKSVSNTDFQFFGFRQISADTVVGAGTWKATEFPSSVLRPATNLLANKPAYLEHHEHAGKTIGTVKNPTWQEAYTLPDSTVIPAGINAEFKINANLQPEIVATLNDPDSPVRHCSVGIYFKWEASHDFENRYEFYENLGKEIEGEQVRRIATEILAFDESSLVANPADKFASRLDEDGQIRYISFSEAKENESNLDWFVANQPFVLEHQIETSPQEYLSFSDADQSPEVADLQADTLSKLTKQLSELQDEKFALQAERDRYKTQFEESDKMRQALSQKFRVESEKYKKAEADVLAFRQRIEELETEKAEAQDIAQKYEADHELVRQLHEQKLEATKAMYRLAFQENAEQSTLEALEAQTYRELEKSFKTYSEMVDAAHKKQVLENQEAQASGIEADVYAEAYNI